MNNFFHWSFSRFVMKIELKIGKSKSIFDFRKLNKIARCGLKIQDFAWRYEIQFETLFMLLTYSKSPWILNYLKDYWKIDLNELWLDRLVEILIANLSRLYFEQEVLHGDLQRLYYDLGDMHTLTLKIKEGIKF
jgi:hypothetical protein